MRKSVQLRIFAMVLFALLASAATAHAQATRTWVSGVGDDANPCSRTAPCKTFAGAISKTAPCGEIDVLDPGGLGALTITKCISIETDDASVAGVLVSGTNGFVIAAGATDVVMIRGLTFDGLGTGISAIKIQSAGAVFVEECWINHFNGNGAGTGAGVDIEPSAPTTNLNVSLREVKIRDNAGAGTFGVFVKPAAGITVKAALDNCDIENNAGGLRADGGQVSVRNSQFSFNSGNGVFANGGTINLESTLISNNGANGAVAQTGGTVRTSNGAIFDNTGIGLFNNSATVISFGNNSIRGNGTDTSGTITNVGTQ
jgi:hypothetical protein